jgi:Fic family protein
MYIHNLEDWPKFSWSRDAVADLLIQVRHKQGVLIGGMNSIGFEDRGEVALQTLTQDVVKSSEIEGEILDQSLVRSSVARKLGIDDGAIAADDKRVDGVVEMMLNATQEFDRVLSQERLFIWHSFLFPSGRSGFSRITVGQWRKGSVQVVSGQMGKELVHFDGPSGDRVDEGMNRFLDWLNNDSKIDAVLKSAIAHLWFVTIHPFDDGNSRIGRAIADMLLARSEKSSQRFYSLSAQIQLERKGYYKILEQIQKGSLDITSWLVWFLNCLLRAIERALTVLEKINHKASVWRALSKFSLNERQKKLINRLLDGFDGLLTTSKWAKIAKCSQDTAYRDILELQQLSILTKNEPKGRSTSYSLREEIWLR